MKRLMKLMVVAILGLSLFAVGAPASAQTATCEVGYTGPNSENMCVSTTSYSCSVTNTNEVTIVNQTTQEATSGTVSVSGNTTGGAASSGTVTNSSGTTFTVSITNANPETETEGVCTATVIVPATTTPQPTATVIPVGGEGAVEVLPATGDDMTLQTVALIAAGLVGLSALSVGALLWYRHAKAL